MPNYNELDQFNFNKLFMNICEGQKLVKISTIWSKLNGFIDYNQIDDFIMCKIIYPFSTLLFESGSIINSSEILNMAISIFNYYHWDRSCCESKLIIDENNNKIVINNKGMYKYQSVRAKKSFEVNAAGCSIFEWVIKKKGTGFFALGVCGLSEFNTEEFAESQLFG
jgi:hypothetical protein